MGGCKRELPASLPDGSGHVVIELPLLWLGGRLNLSWRAHGAPEQRTT